MTWTIEGSTVKYSKGKVADLDSNVVREDYNNITGTMVLFDGRLCYIEGCDRDIGLTLTVDNFGIKNYCFCVRGRSLAHQTGFSPEDEGYDIVEEFIDNFEKQVRLGATCGGIPIITDELLNSVLNRFGSIGENPSAETCAFNQ